jgi:hypothetical protein
MLAGVGFSGALVRAGITTPELRTFLNRLTGLTDNRIATISRCTAVANVLPSRIPAEIFVFGAVFVNATPEEYVKLAFDMGCGDCQAIRLPAGSAIHPCSRI